MDKIVDRKIYNDCNEDINEIEYYACVRNAIRQNLTTWTIPKYAKVPGHPKYGVTCTVPFYSSILPVRYLVNGSSGTRNLGVSGFGSAMEKWVSSCRKKHFNYKVSISYII